ncbi:MAG: polyamine aminopropyltransferase [Candidatus Methanomethyliaceae archaeon]|nr:polyamine aminopropyltransferase [Candidatus Methanomethyliaceae archaeon]
MSLGWKWFIEYQTPNSAHMHGIKSVIYSGKSKMQSIDIVESCEYGKMLILDGKVQSTMRDEYLYHEALVHPAMIAHPRPEEVLIIGGGEGGTLREVLRHTAVRETVMVDIDIEVVESSKRYLPELSRGAFDDGRVELVVGDGRRFVEGCRSRFDVVVVDVTDPLEGGPAQLLYTKEFYEGIKRILNEDGIVVTQATSVYYSAYCFATIYRTVESVFGRAGGYQAWIPAYDSMWGFVYGTKGPDPRVLSGDEVDERLVKRGIGDLKFYEGAIHRALFTLPRELRTVMKNAPVATDSSPTFMPI